MNHSFVAAIWNQKICSKCTKSEYNILGELTHGDTVTCESCPNIGPVNIVGKLLLCPTCEQREINTQPHVVEQAEQLSLETIRQQVDRLIDSDAIKSTNGDTVKSMIDEAISGDLKQYTDFFNAKIPSINDLKKLIDDDPEITDKKYALAHAMRKRVNHLARVLFQLKAGSLEASAEIKAIQGYMEKLIPELRVKLRHEFAQSNPLFTPALVKVSKPKAPKRDASDKLAEGYAKIMKISLEDAKRILANKLRDECTCAETPGMCEMHKK